MPNDQRCPKIIWTLWLDGWEQAPAMVRACLHSWRRLNPAWTVHALTRDNLAQFLPAETLKQVFTTPKDEVEALSDRIRIELLATYGGVWVDATTVCAKPLDTWLPDAVTSGFFAFERPGQDRALASWFLAAEKGSYLIEEWRRRTHAFWFGRLRRGDDNYFWFHQLFAEALIGDPAFRRVWEFTPKLPANHPFHFSPNSGSLMGPMSPFYAEGLADPPSPVFKLSRKQEKPLVQESVADALCQFAEGIWPTAPPSIERAVPEPRRLLVTWYGSFKGHGTVGDLRSLESTVTHLVGTGHQLFHATASEMEFPGATRVQWQDASPEHFDGVIFVCGPILKFHRETNALFTRFVDRPSLALGVSLLPRDDDGYANPFDVTLARQGGDRPYGDVAIVAPPAKARPRSCTSLKIGLALRGAQYEYGEERCLWRETEALARSAASAAASARGGVVVDIENHLARSNLTADGIEAIYADCDLILTSRFHGAITALRQGVPFVAIDHINGGAKVFDLLAPLGLKHVYKINDLTADTRHDAVSELLGSSTLRDEFHRARSKATREANETLRALDEWVASLTPQKRG